MMFKRVLIVISLLVLLLAACAPAAAPAPVEEIYAEPALGAPEAPAFDAAPSADFERTVVEQAAGEGAERIVIKNAREEIVVDQPDQSMDRISQMAEEMGGFVVSANLYLATLDSGEEVPRATITIRVPAERLDEALARIEAESDQLPRNKTIDSQDVTSEYTDLQSRLRNLEAAEAQLVEIMNDALRTEDVLNVYNQLVQVREQIEVIKGQIKYYDESAKLSAISVDLIANAAVQPLTVGGWQPVGVVKEAVQALINALKFLASAAIWIALFLLPVVLIIGVPIYLIVLLIRGWRRRRIARRAAKPQAPPPASE
jgi:hypothetical protein